MIKIMVVEDEKTINDILIKRLNAQGYMACGIQRFDCVLEEVKQVHPDLIILDIILPFYNGFHWCTEIRKISKVPIIFLSSASDNMNIVTAMSMGGDDFVCKPFDMRVLLAKVAAMIRRTYDYVDVKEVYEVKGVVLDIHNSWLMVDNRKIDLTKNELRILSLLMENQGKIVRREDIMQKLWETDEYIDDNTLTVNIARIRKKLDDFGLVDFIKTKKGFGYTIQ